MSKAILKSESPKRCEQIANGECTILLSKTKPKLEPPFKCYIYCKKEKVKEDCFVRSENFGWILCPRGALYGFDEKYHANGKVIGECVVNYVDQFNYYKITSFNEENLGIKRTRYSYLINSDEKKAMCLSDEEVKDYGKGKTLYGLHISQVKIYDKPKELGKFRKPYKYDGEGFIKCKHNLCPYVNEQGHWKYDCTRDCLDLKEQYALTRPPRGWCYVEEENIE